MDFLEKINSYFACSYFYIFLKLCIAPETEDVHGSDVKISELTSLWLFARDAKASIQGKIDGDDVSFEFAVSKKKKLAIDYR